MTKYEKMHAETAVVPEATTVQDRMDEIANILLTTLDILHGTIGPLPEDKCCEQPDPACQMGVIIRELQRIDSLSTRVLSQVRRISESL